MLSEFLTSGGRLASHKAFESSSRSILLLIDPPLSDLINRSHGDSDTMTHLKGVNTLKVHQHRGYSISQDKIILYRSGGG